jgi:integrase
MAAPVSKPRERRKRGEIETLPSGSLRVKVYAGIDPLTGKRHYLTKTVPAGPTAEKEAEATRVQFVHQVNERRNPRTKATVNHLMDRYLQVLDVDRTTRKSYEGYIRKHIRPLLGEEQVGRLDGELLDSFFLVLRTCREHCGGRPYIEHRTTTEHECDERCGPHRCRPLAASSIHQIRACLSGALKRAARWRWITANPVGEADPAPGVRHDPDPPSAEQAARIVNEAFRETWWGVLVWLAMTTGARRGELCALCWDRLDLDNAVLSIRSSIAQDGAETWEKATKTHQQRRIALDAATVSLLRAYRDRCEADAAELGIELAPDSRLFSRSPDHSTWIKPSSVSQRYERMCVRLGWDMHIHQLRHYSATELIAAGVDVRTVAGRLGHGGGGATTLRVYSAWVSEADQRAAGSLNGRMPSPPLQLDRLAEPSAAAEPVTEASAPYQRIAADLRAAIACGALQPGDHLPTVKDLAGRYGVPEGTAHRAVALLTSAGVATASRGRRATVA